MKYLTISDFCKTGSGGTPNRSEKIFYENGSIPWIKSGELNRPFVDSAEENITEEAIKKSSAKLLESGAILLAMYGATVGEVSRLRIRAATNQAICHIYPNKDICDDNYLYRVLQSAKSTLLEKRVGGGQPNISQGIIKDLKIPLPPLPEQKRIAAILDAADALRTQRRQSIAELDLLLQSTFLEMFGDPVENPKGWDVVESINILKIKPRIGTTKPANGKGYLVVRVGELGEKEIAFNKCGRVEISKQDFEKFNLFHGDILIARAIGSKNQLGKASYFSGYKEDVVIDSHVMRLRSDQKKCNPLWLFSLISSQRGKSLLQKAGGETAVQFNINAQQASSIKIPVPPLLMQNQFAEIAEVIEGQKARLQAHLTELDTLFASLQQRAFNGEL